MSRGESLEEALALAQLAWLAEELASLRGRVLALRDRLPAAPHETAEEDTTALDSWSELRSALGCIVADRLTPAIEDLLAAARRGAEVGRQAAVAAAVRELEAALGSAPGRCPASRG